jgi:hypothetical protein
MIKIRALMEKARDLNHLLLGNAQIAGFLFQVKMYTKR